MQIRICIYIVLLVLSFSFNSFSQRFEKLSEQEQKLNDMPGDTVKVNVLINLAEKFRETDAGKSGRYAFEAISLSQKINYSHAISKGCNIIGRIKQFQNKIPAAYEYFQKAYKIASELNDSLQIAECEHNIGDLYKMLGMQEESIVYLKRALKIAELLHDSIEIPAYSDRIGHVFMDWAEASKDKRHFNEALEYYNYSLRVNQKINNLQRLSLSYVNLANANLVFFKNGGKADCLKKSIDFSLQGVSIAEKCNASERKALNLLNIGEAYYYLKEYDNAISYYEKAFELYNESDKKLWIAAVNRDFALAYKEKKEYALAIKYLEQSNRIIKEFNDAEPYENYQVLAELYTDKGDYERAFGAYKKYQELLNRSLNTKSTLEIERLQLEFDSEKKDKEIILLNKEKQLSDEKLRTDKIIYYLLIGFTLFVIVLSVLLYNRSRLLKKSKEISDHARIMQEQFLANTSHEIRTPMNGIIGMTSHLLNSPLSEDQKQSVKLIKTSADNLLRIINDVLDLSKISAGKLDFHKKEFIADLLFDQLYKLLQPRAQEKGLKLEFIISPEIPVILIGDALRLEQILINIISNAIKFTEAGAIILDVSLKSEAKEEVIIEFKIKDTGIGIPDKKLQEVFDDFVQIESAGNRKYGGAGLGLAITKRLIEMQGGNISVSSRLDVGTEFVFELPVKTGNLPNYISQLFHQKSIVKHEKDLDRLKILVVEDNIINQQVIVNTLVSWKASYMLASTAVECFDVLMENQVDLILMDIELPGISGWEATQYIRTKFAEDKNNVPIIALTAYAYESDKQKCMDSGMNDVVVKPFSPDELYFKIRALVFNEKNNHNDIIQKKEEGTDRIFNFEILRERYEGNKEGLREMMELFINEIPAYLQDLEELNKKEDIEGIRKQAHKMKSPMGLIGSVQITKLLTELNSYDILQNAESRNDLVAKVISNSNILIMQLNVKYGEMQL